MSAPSAPAKLDVKEVARELRTLLDSGRTEEAVTQVVTLLTQLMESNTNLSLRLQKALKAQFGRKSEKMDSGQLGLLLELLKTPTQAETEAPESATPDAPEADATLPKPAPKPRKGHGRNPLPPELPREEVVLQVTGDERTCHTCNQEKSLIGFDATQTLEFVPASFKVIVHKQEKLACRACEEGVTRAPPPDRVIDAGLPGPGLLAHVLTSKYQDNIPLNRLSGIYERSGVDIAVSTLADWVGSTTDVLAPLSDAILTQVLASHVLQSDDTGLKVLDKDSPHGIKKGHVWVYGGDSKWAAFRYTPDWKADGLHGPQEILKARKGWVVVDGYAGYEDLFTRPNATAIEAGC